MLGFVLNFIYVVWEKWTKPEQRPDTFLEVFVMIIFFIVGILIWPLAWGVRISDWSKKK
jgi:hypothetical protein